MEQHHPSPKDPPAQRRGRSLSAVPWLNASIASQEPNPAAMCMALSSVSYAAWAMWWRVIWRPGLATRWYNKLLNGTRARLGKKLLQKQDSANLAPQYGSIALDHSCSPAIPCMVNLSDVHGIPIRCKDLLNASFWTLSIYLVYRRIKFAKENFHLLHDSIWIWLNMIEWYWMWLNMIEYDWILFTSDYLSPQCQPKPGTDLQNPHNKVGRPV
jgi:hypothetical protein